MGTSLSPHDQAALCFNISDHPYENYFYSDQNISCQVVLASPLPQPENDAKAIHRLLFAWPGGNSGAVVFFTSTLEKEQELLHVKLLSGSQGRILDPIVKAPENYSSSNIPSVGVSGRLEISHEATLNLAILGSVRSVRDYTEGHGILNPKVQQGIRIAKSTRDDNAIDITRLWFDGKTTTCLTFAPEKYAKTGAAKLSLIQEESRDKIAFAPGVYLFNTHLNYPQPSCISPTQLLKPSFHHLLLQKQDAVNALSFLSSPVKLLAGGWRFLTYFGRDTLISLLLLGDILSEGEHGAIEAGLSAVLERINFEDGSVCHEENIGDYPAAQAALDGNEKTDAEYDYKMVLLGKKYQSWDIVNFSQIDTDFFLPIVMEQYFVKSAVGRARLSRFLE